MTPEAWIAIGGFVTTLAAVALTHWFGGAGEKRRIAAEDRRRWHDQRYRTVSDLIAQFIRADYRLTDLANTLPGDVGGDEGIRRASYIYEDSETGEDQLFEPAWIQSVISGGREVHRELDEAHRLVVDLSVVASGPVVDLAWRSSKAVRTPRWPSGISLPRNRPGIRSRRRGSNRSSSSPRLGVSWERTSTSS